MFLELLVKNRENTHFKHAMCHSPVQGFPQKNVATFQTAITPSKLTLGIKVGWVLKSFFWLALWHWNFLKVCAQMPTAPPANGLQTKVVWVLENSWNFLSNEHKNIYFLGTNGWENPDQNCLPPQHTLDLLPCQNYMCNTCDYCVSPSISCHQLSSRSPKSQSQDQKDLGWH